MLTKLRLNLSEKINKQVEKTYKAYKQNKLRKLQQKKSNLVAKEKALLLKLAPIQKEIDTINADIRRLESSL